MFRKSMIILIVVLFSLAAAIPALAHAPADGTVVEGVSVPGVALGDTRAQVQAAYGDPFSCTSGYNVDDDATCRYPVEGFADHLVSIWINFRGPDGGLPSASPDDVVSSVSWQDSISGWVTEPGAQTGKASHPCCHTMGSETPIQVVAPHDQQDNQGRYEQAQRNAT